MKIAFFQAAKASAFALSSIVLITLFESGTFAQASRPIASVERRIQTMDQQSKQYEMENMGREDKKPKVDAKRAREIKNEIAQDLNGLQTAYNDLVVALQGSSGFSEPLLRESSAAVRKMALRLKTNLTLPSLESGESKADAAEIPQNPRLAARSLGKLIYEFITNPIFESTSGLDVNLAGKASRDLDKIIAFTASPSGI